MSSMTESEIHDILHRRDRWVALTTVGLDGFPHSIPIGFFLDGQDIVMGCRDGTQKVKNIERNPKVSVLWENGRGQPALQGILIQGRARVVRDEEERLRLKAVACALRGEKPPEKVSPGAVYVVVEPLKIISWNRPSSIAGKK